MLSRPARLRRTDSCAGSPCAAHGVFRSPKKNKKKRKGQTRGRPKEGELPAWLIFLILLRAPSVPPPLLPNLGPGNVCGGPDSFSSQENCVACDKGAKLTLPCSWPEAIFYFVCSPKKKNPAASLILFPWKFPLALFCRWFRVIALRLTRCNGITG